MQEENNELLRFKQLESFANGIVNESIKFKQFETSIDNVIAGIIDKYNRNIIISNENNNYDDRIGESINDYAGYHNQNNDFLNTGDINKINNNDLYISYIEKNKNKSANRSDISVLRYSTLNKEKKDINNFGFVIHTNIISRYVNVSLMSKNVNDSIYFDIEMSSSMSELKKALLDLLNRNNLIKENDDYYMVKYNGFNLLHKYNDTVDNTITGRVYPSTFVKYLDVKTFKHNKIQVIDTMNIKNNLIRTLMTSINFNWYIYVYQKLYIVQKSSDILYINRNNSLFRLFYTTRTEDTSLNVNFNSSHDKNNILGFQFYLSKTESNNIVNFMFLTTCPILVSVNAKSNRNVSSNNYSISNYGKKCTLSYILNNKMYRRYGEINISTDVILGPSLYTDTNEIRGDLIEYKFINKMVFTDELNTIVILVIPFIVNSSREACYKYDIIIKFYRKNKTLECTLTGNDFYIYEELVTKFIECIQKENFNEFEYKGFPAAFDNNGLVIPPITDFDKIIVDNKREISNESLIEKVYCEKYNLESTI